jgi:hypothetical protein
VPILLLIVSILRCAKLARLVAAHQQEARNAVIVPTENTRLLLAMLKISFVPYAVLDFGLLLAISLVQNAILVNFKIRAHSQNASHARKGHTTNNKVQLVIYFVNSVRKEDIHQQQVSQS